LPGEKEEINTCWGYYVSAHELEEFGINEFFSREIPNYMTLPIYALEASPVPQLGKLDLRSI